jgi:hypothetical protein
MDSNQAESVELEIEPCRRAELSFIVIAADEGLLRGAGSRTRRSAGQDGACIELHAFNSAVYGLELEKLRHQPRLSL